jgi:hypothetical protein
MLKVGCLKWMKLNTYSVDYLSPLVILSISRYLEPSLLDCDFVTKLERSTNHHSASHSRLQELPDDGVAVVSIPKLLSSIIHLEILMILVPETLAFYGFYSVPREQARACLTS